MRPVSAGFLAAMRVSHRIEGKVDLYFPGNPTPTTVRPLAGALTIDRTAQVRRSGSIVIPWSLAQADELGLDVRLLALGGYAVPWRGIGLPDGSTELVALGYMRVESVTWSTREETATLELADRMAQVIDEPFDAPYTASGLRVANAAKAIVLGVFPSVTVRVLYDPAVTLADVIYSGSRVDALMELARSVGAETYFDADGAWVFDVAAGGTVIARTGTLTDNSSVITGLSSTSDLAVGMTVIGVGIPAYRRIASINSASQITLNAPANILATKNSRTEHDSPILTDVTDTDDLSIGMSASGTGIPAGAKIVALAPAQVTLDRDATADGYPLVTYTAPTPAALTFAGAAQAYPVWAIDAGATGVLVDAGESLARSGVYNGVLVTGQATAVTASFSVLVVDSDVDSPTEWGGPFGKVLRIENSNAVQNVTQGQTMGQALLNDGLGLTRTLTIASAPNPALEAGDTVTVIFGDGRTETHLVEAVSHDLGVGPMTLATRTVAKPSDIARWVPAAKVFTGEDVWRELRGAIVAERVRRRVPA